MSVHGFRWLVFMLAFALPLGAQAAIHVFLASLDAAQEQAQVISPAVGSAILSFDDQTNTFDLTLAGVGLTTPITAAHFHVSPSGAIVKDLGVPGSFQQPGGYAFHSIYTDAAAGGLRLVDLLAGNSYINVHTVQYPGGEIRGQPTQLVPIPEPGTWALFVGGLLLLARSALRRRESGWGTRIH